MHDSAAYTKLQACLNLTQPQLRKESLEKLTEEFFDYLPAKLSLAKEYFKSRQRSKLIGLLNLDPAYSRTLYLQFGQWLINNKLSGFAIELLEEEAKNGKADLFINLKIAEAYLVAEQRSQAKTWFEKCKALARNNIRVRLFGIRLEVDEGNYTRAKQLLRKIKISTVNHFPLLAQLSQFYVKCGEPNTAIAIYNRLADRATADSEVLEAKLKVVDILVEQKELSKAKIELEKLSGFFPKSEEISIQLCRILIAEEKIKEGTALLRNTLINSSSILKDSAAQTVSELIPKLDRIDASDILKLYKGQHLGLLRWKSLFAMKQGQYKDAYDVLYPLVMKEPQKIGIQLVWSRLNMKVGNYREVEETINRLLKYYPESKAGRELIVDCYLMQGKTGMVKKFLNYCEKQSGLSDHLRILWARLYKVLGQFGAAISSLKEIEERSGADAFMLAELYLLQYNYPKALKYLDKTIEFQYNIQNSIRYKARALMITGQWTEAEILLTQTMGGGLSERLKERVEASPVTPQYRELKLLNEFKADTKAMENLKVHLNKSKGYSTQLAELLLKRRQYLGYHFFYLKALREEGLLEQNSESKDSISSIPKNLVQYWHEDSLPLPLQLSTASWKKHNPDYKYSLYSEKSARTFIVENFGKEVKEAYDRCKIIAEKADLFRLAFLYKKGGIYADVDDLCLQNLDTLLEGHHSFIVYQEGLAIGNNFIAVTKGNEIIKMALEVCVRNLLSYVVEPSWYKTGPIVLTEQVTQVLARTQVEKGKLDTAEISIVSQETIRQYVQPHLPLSYKELGNNWLRAAYPEGK